MFNIKIFFISLILLSTLSACSRSELNTVDFYMKPENRQKAIETMEECNRVGSSTDKRFQANCNNVYQASNRIPPS